jgi:3-dehydroquinate dehydratase-2
MSKPVFILNGANLNMLGVREPAIYGTATLADLNTRCAAKAAALGLRVDCRQTNAEGELIGWIHAAHTEACAVILNAGGWTHTSVALLDALKILTIPVIEVHLTNPAAREPFRRTSFVAQAATAVVAGLGPMGYELALDAVAQLCHDNA